MLSALLRLQQRKGINGKFTPQDKPAEQGDLIYAKKTGY